MRKNGRIKRGFVAALGTLLSVAICALNYTQPMRALRALPDTIRISDASEAALPRFAESLAPWLIAQQSAVPASASGDERLQDVQRSAVTYRLFGVLPLRTVETVRSESVYLVPGGTAVGITIRTQGVLVVGLGAVDTPNGVLSPGSAAGIRAGDVILEANGQSVLNADHLAKLVRSSGGRMEVTLERGAETFKTQIQLVRDTDGGDYRIGLWVRDSTAGVGTLSFYDPKTGWFGALGHPVSDIDTQSLLSVRDGRILPTEIVNVRRGEQGSPGELIGEFSVSGQAMGEIRVNSEFGIYGKTARAYQNPICGEIPMAYGFEAHTGAAKLIATISHGGAQAFDCEIIRVNPQSEPATKGMVVDVTDETLLRATGGIVQGMSGAPIIQDGRLIGIVTHVFVNDPTRGYCVYAEWMHDQIEKSEPG